MKRLRIKPLFEFPKVEEVRKSVSANYWKQREKRLSTPQYQKVIKKFLKACRKGGE